VYNLRVWFLTGFTDVLKTMFPPFPTPDFVPDYGTYDLDQRGLDWYTIHESVAQTPREALKMVKSLTNNA